MSPDGRAIVFTTARTRRSRKTCGRKRKRRKRKGRVADGRPRRDGEAKKKSQKRERKSARARHVLTHAVYRMNEEAISIRSAPSSWTVPVPRSAGRKSEPRQLTTAVRRGNAVCRGCARFTSPQACRGPYTRCQRQSSMPSRRSSEANAAPSDGHPLPRAQPDQRVEFMPL